jgi:hypothetical protein
MQYESPNNTMEDKDLKQMRQAAEQEKQKHLLEFQDIIRQS